MKAAIFVLALLAVSAFAVDPAPAAAAAAPAAAAPAAPAAAPAATAPTAAAPAAVTPATVIADPSVEPIEHGGKLFYPVNVVDPNAPQRVYLGEGDAFRTMPAEVVHSTVYGLPAAATAVLPPIPAFGPKYHRRAMHRVRKSLELLDRAYDALSAHLKQLSAMRAKVQAKLDYLQTEQLNRGYMVLPEKYDGNFNGHIARKFLRSYLLNAMEQGASAKPHKHEITPKDVAALIESASEVDEQ